MNHQALCPRGSWVRELPLPRCCRHRHRPSPAPPWAALQGPWGRTLWLCPEAPASPGGLRGGGLEALLAVPAAGHGQPPTPHSSLSTPGPALRSTAQQHPAVGTKPWGFHALLMGDPELDGTGCLPQSWERTPTPQLSIGCQGLGLPLGNKHFLSVRWVLRTTQGSGTQR